MPYADPVRFATGLPVFDVVSLVDFAINASSALPRFGLKLDELLPCHAARMPAIGVLRLDHPYPGPSATGGQGQGAGDPWPAGKYCYNTLTVTAVGVGPEVEWRGREPV